MEEWKQYLDTVYEVSSLGNIRNSSTGKNIKCCVDKYGYLVFSSYSNKKIQIKLHRAIGITFLPNKNNYSTIDHINRNKIDNRVENLRWASLSEQQLNKNSMGEIPYKGVCRKGNSFQARIVVNGKRKHLGTFKTAEEASNAYEDTFKEAYGIYKLLGK